MADQDPHTKAYETNNAKLAAAFVAGNHLSFNKELAAFGKEFYFRGFERIVGINFCQFNLMDCHFEKVVFSTCRFSKVSASLFSNCQFIDGTRCELDVLDSLSFSGCEFGKIRIQTELKDCEFLGCKFLDAEFIDAKFSNSLTVKNSFGFTSSKGLASARDETDFRNLVNNKNSYHHTWVNWASLRFLLKLPILKVSYLAIFIMVFLMVVLGGMDDSIREFSEQGGLSEYPSLQEWAISVLNHWNSVGVQKSMSRNITSFFFLAIGATMFNFGCPEVVRDYSKNKWVLEIGNGEYIYDAYSHSRFFVCLASLFFVLIGATYLAVKYAKPIVNFLVDFGSLIV